MTLSRCLPLSNIYLPLASNICEAFSEPRPGPFYFAWGGFRYFVSGTPSGDDHDPAAQLCARRAAELAQQPRLGASRIRPVAAKPFIMIARDQQALFGRR